MKQGKKMAEPSSEPSSKDKALSRQDKKFLEAACEISVLAPSGDEILFNNGKILSPNGPVYGGKIIFAGTVDGEVLSRTPSFFDHDPKCIPVLLKGDLTPEHGRQANWHICEHQRRERMEAKA